jgi:hypothetical protein
MRPNWKFHTPHPAGGLSRSIILCHRNTLLSACYSRQPEHICVGASEEVVRTGASLHRSVPGSLKTAHVVPSFMVSGAAMNL